MGVGSLSTAMISEGGAWNELADKPTLLRLLGWCATEANDGERYNKSDLADGGNVARTSVVNYVDDLIELGVLQPTTVSRGSQSYTAYYVDVDHPLLEHFAAIDQLYQRHK